MRAEAGRVRVIAVIQVGDGGLGAGRAAGGQVWLDLRYVNM